ncbi:LapA family protein [Deinococcus radiomollis]|uniref:LapA family protein n=1 Tax=Deinococcus radiomollis TaxID=468916 RepID=UPI0038915C43
MRFNLNTLLLAILAVLTIVFLIPAENRNTLTAPHTLSIPGLGVSQNVPVGSYLLIGWLFTAILFALVNTFSRLRRDADSARILRDMESLRANLDKAEGSRFAELQAYLERRLNDLQTQVSAQAGGNSDTTAQLNTMRNELAADLGQMDGYLKRKLGE